MGAGMGLRMACVEDGDCQDEANLVCGSDGFDRVCLCDSGYVEEGSGCSESPAQPGEPCDGRMRCAKRTNMVCDQFLKPPRCDCMAGTLWQENKCVALFGTHRFRLTRPFGEALAYNDSTMLESRLALWAL
ncbi:hypothetical protein HPB51_012981 [Rhipicephalus microplus]|uniref:Uncharacterized protein n=1 Tax=Rhipicephalus microplus TaxID=6941 RepID=A0A9J6F2E9_RHIMP|nr:hypothetical protein HPB51_012981 [Rhipicephalus microplus]